MELLGNRILVLREPPIEKTDSGIFIPEQSQVKRQIGTIVKIGHTVPEHLGGKTILFDPNCGMNIEYKGATHLLIFTPDIRAIIKTKNVRSN